MIRKLLAGTALAGVLVTAASCGRHHDVTAPRQPAAAATAASPVSASPSAPTNRGELLQEAVSALHETNNALITIDHNNTKDAIAALETATGKLEIVLTRTPTLALAPVDISTSTYDLLGDDKAVETLRRNAQDALAAGRLQDARHMISGLASETVVSVSSLPLATYPTAIKSAATLLSEGKTQQAKALLQTALNTIVVEDTVIPLPIVRAEVAIEQAKGLSEKADRSDADNAKLHALLGTARGQLRFGKALGYATDKDMDDLLKAVDDVEAKTSGQKHGLGLLDHITDLFHHARQTNQPVVRKP